DPLARLARLDKYFERQLQASEQATKSLQNWRKQEEDRPEHDVLGWVCIGIVLLFALPVLVFQVVERFYKAPGNQPSTAQEASVMSAAIDGLRIPLCFYRMPVAAQWKAVSLPRPSDGTTATYGTLDGRLLYRVMKRSETFVIERAQIVSGE